MRFQEKTVSSAVTNATSDTVSTEAAMKLSEEQMSRQKSYEGSLFFVKKMHASGIISDLEYQAAKDFLEARKRPLIRH